LKNLKKPILIIFLCVIILLISYILIQPIIISLFPHIKEDYSGWKDVYLENLGTFKISEEWFVSQERFVVCITDKPIEEEHIIYLVGAILNYDTEEKNISPNDFLENVEYIGLVNSQVFSNGGMYGQNEYKINDEIAIKYFISFSTNEYGVLFIVWDDTIDEEMIRKIAISFKSN